MLLSNLRERGWDLLHTGGKSIADSLCYLVLGEAETAVQDLVRAHDAGWLGYYDEELENIPLYRDVLQDPRIKQVKTAIDEALNEQKPMVYQLLAEQGLITNSL